jgi:hypothetical protein
VLRLLVPERGSETSGEQPLEALVAAQEREGRELLLTFRANQHLGAYISGLPGVGKSTVLLHLILDDIRAGRACCVLDPHGDLISAILARCPDDRTVLERIVLFDPSDLEWPMGINILDADTERGRDLAVQFMLELYDELFLPEHQGPMLHQALRNGMRLLMEGGGSLSELGLLFTDKAFVKSKLEQSKDPWIHNYFEKVWLPWSGNSHVEMIAYCGAKLSCFIDDLILRFTLGQSRGLDFAELLNNGGVLLADLSRGAIGEFNSRLLGMVLLHKLERVAMERGRLAPEERPRLNIYVDEFHELATGGLVRFLGAARKFNVAVTLAHQRLETLPVRLREAVLGAMGQIVLFRQRGAEGFSLLPRLVWPRFGEVELLSLPNHHAVARVTGSDGKPKLGRVLVPPPGVESDSAGCVRALSRAHYGRPRAEVEAEILERLGWRKTTE